MSQSASEFYICLSIFWAVICLAKSGRCPLDAVHNPVDCEKCSSSNGNHNGLQNTIDSYFSLNYAAEHPKTVPVTESGNICDGSMLFCLRSALDGLHSDAQCSRTGVSDVNSSGSGAASAERSTGQDRNASWSSDHRIFHEPDGGMVRCSLNYVEPGHHMSSYSVDKADRIAYSFCGTYQKKINLSSKNLEIEKLHSPYASAPRVNISPGKLDWGRNHLYHPSVAFLRLENACNESSLKVYEPFSTNTQFYPFNFSEIVLGPGEVTVISFVFLPMWLGLSSAELVLQTSFGGFLVKAEGFAVESPHKLMPLMEMGISSGGWLSRKLSLSNPFDETIHLEGVTALVSVLTSSGPLLAEAICKKRNVEASDEHSKSYSRMKSSSESIQLNSLAMEIKPLSKWVISPQSTESILEMMFPPDSEGQVSGAICLQLPRPLEGEKDTLVVPFEVELNKAQTWKDTAGLLSVSLEASGHHDASQNTVSVSVRNNASHLLKIVRISEASDKNKIFKIKYSEGLLLFPGTVTKVAVVSFESSNVKYDKFVRMNSVKASCMLHIETNNTVGSVLEVSCQEIYSILAGNQWKPSSYQDDDVHFSSKLTGSLTSSRKLPVPNEALDDVQEDEPVLQNWRGQSTMSGFYVLDDHELLFPIVPIGRYYAKSVTVKNPTNEPVVVQLILNSGGTTNNCKNHYGHLQPPPSSSFIHNDSARPSSYGFSTVDNTVQEVYLHPFGSASLGPILFHPSNRCEWESSAMIRNNLSGVEWVYLRGFGGSLSIGLLDGSEPVHRLDFKHKSMSPDVSPTVVGASCGCHKPLSKNLFAVNAGDFPIIVQGIHVSGTECGLDGFLVHNCKGFALEPGESVELSISYQTDFSAPVIQRDLELILAAGILVIPMRVSLPPHIVNYCRKFIFWVRVKKCCIAIVIAAILMSLLFWSLMLQMAPSGSVDFLMEGEKSSTHVGSPGGKSSTKNSCLSSVQSDQAAPSLSPVTCSKCKHRDLKQLIVAEQIDPSLEGQTEIGSPPSDTLKEIGFRPSLLLKSVPVETAGTLQVAQPVSLTVNTRKDKRRRPRKRKGAAGSGLMALVEVSSSQSGNSTPSSPLSPVTTLSPEASCSPYLSKKEHQYSSSPTFTCAKGGSYDIGEEVELGIRTDATASAEVSGNSSDLFSTQPRKTGNRPMLLNSATFPGPSRLAIGPHARAPGLKLPQAVQPEEQAKLADRFTYDIWGNHFSGLQVMARRNDRSGMGKEAIGGDSDSFFLKGPQETLMTNCRSSYVSSFYRQG